MMPKQQLLPLFHQENREASGPILPQPALTVAGLFAGIGGIEHGLHQAGHAAALLCELDPAASEVLRQKFPQVRHHRDVTTLESLPGVDLVSAGFPCQDLSISGRRVGITGDKSSLVGHVFRLLDGADRPPKWLLLENVPFMLQLQNGRGMAFLIEELEARKFNWAYRVIDTRAFGIPHRRHRVILLASQSGDPKHVLLGEDAEEPRPPIGGGSPACGFYWTEGNRGVGWSEECVPPIKVGSGLGIPSSPAIWDPTSHSIFKLDIRDVERLQGFPEDWTVAAERVGKRSGRWKLVGNSVSVPLGAWLGKRLREPTTYVHADDWPLVADAAWPQAAWGGPGGRYSSSVSHWPVSNELPRLLDFLRYRGEPLSSRAAAGLVHRIVNGSTRVPDPFWTDLQAIAEGEKKRLARVKCRKLENEIARLRAATRSETQFAAQVELSEKVRTLEAERAQALAHLVLLEEKE